MPRTPGEQPQESPIAGQMIATMVHEAERGYGVEEIKRRRDGRPSIGSAAPTVEYLRPDPELKRDLSFGADEHKSALWS